MIHRTDTGFKRTGLKKRFAAMMPAAAVASSWQPAVPVQAGPNHPMPEPPPNPVRQPRSRRGCGKAGGDNRFPVRRGQFHLRIATVVTGDHAWVQMGEYMAEQLKERSGGAIEATVFPGGQLGNDEGTIDDMRTGALDIVIGSLRTQLHL